MLYNGIYSPTGPPYDSAPEGTPLAALLAKCTADAQCQAVQYPDMLLLDEPPTDALVYDKPETSAGECQGTYMRLPKFMARPTGELSYLAYRVPGCRPGFWSPCGEL